MTKIKKAIPYLKPNLKGAQSTFKIQPEYEAVFKNLGNGLLVAYLVDVGDMFEYVQQRDLTRSALTEQELHEISLKNLNSMVKSRLNIRPYKNVFAAFLDGNFESSLLLENEFWDSTVAHLRKDGFMAVVPTRDVLAFCDISTPGGLDELRAIAARAEGGDHLITPALFKRQGESWLRYID